mmetsp:Transcript_3701/g.10955  ORF Transcript_3701/g.10955 Transcript_3701/m.10955 type:complete len:331 (-) Transcript_3701:46-1038(-)
MRHMSAVLNVDEARLGEGVLERRCTLLRWHDAVLAAPDEEGLAVCQLGQELGHADAPTEHVLEVAVVPARARHRQAPNLHGIICGEGVGIGVRHLVGHVAQPLGCEHIDARLGKGPGEETHGPHAVHEDLRVHEAEAGDLVGALRGKLDGKGCAQRGAHEGHSTANLLLHKGREVPALGRCREVPHTLAAGEAPAEQVHGHHLHPLVLQQGHEAPPLEARGVKAVQQEHGVTRIAAPRRAVEGSAYGTLRDVTSVHVAGLQAASHAQGGRFCDKANALRKPCWEFVSGLRGGSHAQDDAGAHGRGRTLRGGAHAKTRCRSGAEQDHCRGD